MATINYAGQVYKQFDSMLKELETSAEETSKVKKFSGGGLLTRNMGSSFSEESDDSVDMKQEQLKIPLLAMQEIRKRRMKKNGIS
jgi:hypothetical protein|tara:strand:- start:4958 stop:5212 length:255 start_codon:yes stop_codon:yes gene_type:complete